MEPHISSPWEQLDWPGLLAAARSGAVGAVDQIFQRLGSYGCLVAGGKLPPELVSKVGASDIAQQSLLEAFASFQSFSGSSEAEIRAWFSSIVHFNVIDAARHFRDAERRSCKRELPLLDDGATPHLAAICQPPSAALRRKETDLALHRAVARLSDKQRQVIELRFRDGLDYHAIAAAMGMSEVAARKLGSRAIETLRKFLATDDESRRKSPY